MCTCADLGATAADFIVLAIGNKPRSELVETLDKNALDAQNLTRVESSLQVVGHPRIFAVGDVTDVKVGPASVARGERGS